MTPSPTHDPANKECEYKKCPHHGDRPCLDTNPCTCVPPSPAFDDWLTQYFIQIPLTPEVKAKICQDVTRQHHSSMLTTRQEAKEEERQEVVREVVEILRKQDAEWVATGQYDHCDGKGILGSIADNLPSLLQTQQDKHD